MTGTYVMDPEYLAVSGAPNASSPFCEEVEVVGAK